MIPTDPSQREWCAHAFGELFAFGKPRTLAILALCDVACAEMETVRALDPDAGGEPLFALVETDREASSVQGIDSDLRWKPTDWTLRDPGEETRRSEARIEALTRLLEDVLVPDEPALERRVRQAKRQMDPARLRQLEEALEIGGPISGVLARQGAAISYRALRRSGSPGAESVARVKFSPLVTQEGTMELAPRGSRWDRDPERYPDPCPTCGMGSVPRRSATFLAFFTEARRR